MHSLIGCTANARNRIHAMHPPDATQRAVAQPAPSRALKIGLLTFHRCINYGSYWQARLLIEGLRDMGHHAVLLDYHSPRANLAEWRCALRPVLPTAVSPADRRLYAQKTRKFFEAFEALPRSCRFSLERPQDMEDFDAIVVGSDEVWNFSHPWYGQSPLFFGDFGDFGDRGARTRKCRLVAYAASFGNYPAHRGLPSRSAQLLHAFHGLSVRDRNSRDLVAHHLGRRAALVLDPCLQFAPAARVRTPGCDVEGERCVAVYGHNFSNWFATRTRDWARRHGMRLVSVGYRNDWADEQWLTAGPEDFAHFMSQVGAVATNFFHGCVFSLRNGKPFACEPSPYRSIKINDLLRTLGAQSHLPGNDTPTRAWDHLMTAPLASSIGARMAAARASSTTYLRGALATAAGP